MNPQDIINMKNDITNLSETVTDIQKFINGFKLTSQRVLKSNPSIPPGIACKVAYDSNGLILQGKPLEIEDIPELSIDRIKNLQETLDTRVSRKELESLEKKISPSKKKTIKAGTGTKVNYDENGSVISSADLLPGDIPTLHIDKIEGLNERLIILESKESVDVNIPNKDPINPGTFCKITYDNDGRVVSGSKLSIDDIPIEIINRLNLMETGISELATKTNVNSIIKNTQDALDKKISEVKSLIKDVPEVTINSIPNLESILRKKADQADLVQLTNMVSTIVEHVKPEEISSIKNQMQKKADISEVTNIRNQLSRVQKNVESLSQRLPNEHIGIEIKELKDMIIKLAGQVSVLERKLK